MRIRTLITAMLLSAIPPCLLTGQTAAALLNGAVSDASGAMIVNAEVVREFVQRGIRLELGDKPGLTCS
jgi:H+/gluconate symporter-like permease